MSKQYHKEFKKNPRLKKELKDIKDALDILKSVDNPLFQLKDPV